MWTNRQTSKAMESQMQQLLWLTWVCRALFPLALCSSPLQGLLSPGFIKVWSWHLFLDQLKSQHCQMQSGPRRFPNYLSYFKMCDYIYIHPTFCIWGAAPLFAHKYTFAFSQKYSPNIRPRIKSLISLFSSCLWYLDMCQFSDVKKMLSAHVGAFLWHKSWTVLLARTMKDLPADGACLH